MRLGSFSAIITSMFKDRMTVYRYTSEEAVNGSTTIDLSVTPTYKDIPCRISFLSEESPKHLDVDQTPVFTMPKIFFSTSYRLLAGDHVIVNRINDDGDIIATYEGEAGLPAMFVTHQEALFAIRGSA